jgi:hypothetical protein
VNEAEIWLSCKDDLVRYAAALIGPADAETVDLPRDLLRSVAEGVRPVSVAEWETIASSATTTSTESS